jgi:hypothetical protein
MFSDTELIKNISYKIFKEVKDYISDIYPMQPQFSQLKDDDSKKNFEFCFFNENFEPPYQIAIVMKDG